MRAALLALALLLRAAAAAPVTSAGLTASDAGEWRFGDETRARDPVLASVSRGPEVVRETSALGVGVLQQQQEEGGGVIGAPIGGEGEDGAGPSTAPPQTQGTQGQGTEGQGTGAPATEAPAPATEAPAPATEASAPATEASAPATEPPAPATEAPAPATDAPSTEAPVTEVEVPATEAPTPGTEAPATEAPAPATEAPVPATEVPAPATEAPAPVTEAPAPATEASAPASEAPATDAPATDAQATQVPASEAPATEAPATEAPATEAPATEAPATEAPATEAPATEAPATEAPATEAPATEAPTAAAEAPQTEPPATQAPGTQAVETEAQGTEAQVTEAAAAEAPGTVAQATGAPATSAPAQEAQTEAQPAPGTEAVEEPAATQATESEETSGSPSIIGVPIGGSAPTDAPDTGAPVTEAPAAATEAVATEAPATEAPATEAPATEAPVTAAPVTPAPVTQAAATEAPATAPPFVPTTMAATAAPLASTVAVTEPPASTVALVTQPASTAAEVVESTLFPPIAAATLPPATAAPTVAVPTTVAVTVPVATAVVITVPLPTVAVTTALTVTVAVTTAAAELQVSVFPQAATVSPASGTTEAQPVPVPNKASSNTSLTPVIVGPPQETIAPLAPFPSNSPVPEVISPTTDSDVIITANEASPAPSPSVAPSIEPEVPITPVDGNKTSISIAPPSPSASPAKEDEAAGAGSANENGASGSGELGFGTRESGRGFAAGMGILGVLLIGLLGVCLFFAIARGSYTHYTGGASTREYRGGQGSFENQPSQAASAAIRAQDDREEVWEQSYGTMDHGEHAAAADRHDLEDGRPEGMSMGYGGYGAPSGPIARGRSRGTALPMDLDEEDGDLGYGAAGGMGAGVAGGAAAGAAAAGGTPRRQNGDPYIVPSTGSMHSRTDDYPEEEYRIGITGKMPPHVPENVGEAPGEVRRESVLDLYGATPGHREIAPEARRRSTYKYDSPTGTTESGEGPPLVRPARRPPPPPPPPPAFPETMSSQSSRPARRPPPPPPKSGFKPTSTYLATSTDPTTVAPAQMAPYGAQAHIERQGMHSFEGRRSVTPPGSVQEPASSGSQRRVLDAAAKFEHLDITGNNNEAIPAPQVIGVHRAIILPVTDSAAHEPFKTTAKKDIIPKVGTSLSPPKKSRKHSPSGIQDGVFDPSDGDQSPDDAALLSALASRANETNHDPDPALATSVDTGSGDVPWYLDDPGDSGGSYSGATTTSGPVSSMGTDEDGRGHTSPRDGDDTVVSFAKSRSSFESGGLTYIPRPGSGPVISYLRGKEPPIPLSKRLDEQNKQYGSESSRSVVQTTPQELRRMREPFVKQQAARLSSEEEASSGASDATPKRRPGHDVPSRSPNALNKGGASSPIPWLRGSDASRFS